jgi:hypothetical protein
VSLVVADMFRKENSIYILCFIGRYLFVRVIVLCGGGGGGGCYYNIIHNPILYNHIQIG